MTEALNLATLLARDSDRPALIVGDRTVSHRQLADRVARWRGGLVSAGVRQGDRVAIVAANGEEFVVAHLASLGVGALSVPLNPQSPPAELARELVAIDPFAVVADRGATPRLTEALALSTDLQSAVIDLDDLDGAAAAPIAEVPSDSPAVLLFTSGTAGTPKPATLTHANLAAGLQAVISLPIDLVAADHVYLGVIPLFHVFGLNMVLHLALLTESSLVLGEFTGPEPTIELIARHGVTVVAGPPTMWRSFVRAPTADVDAFKTVSLAVSGAAKLAPQLKLDVMDRLGVELTEGYGLTETSAVVASSMATDAPLGSVGRLLPGVEARIVDQNGLDCLVGDPGELLVKGPMVFAGYWGAIDRVANPVDDQGWLRTGDVAIVDEDGYLAIVDRRKDLIIVSGFNVFPVEVESVLLTHPDVAQAGVRGEPSEATGEAVVAFVVPEEGVVVDEEDLRRHCSRELARYKVPSRMVIAPDLPIGPTGKLQRNRLP